MSFTGNESEEITLQEATDWNQNYRDENPGSVKAHFFGKTQLMKILNQTDCAGIRAYYAIDDDGKKQLVLTGVDYSEKDMVNGVLLERSIPCPNNCDVTSPLC